MQNTLPRGSYTAFFEFIVLQNNLFTGKNPTISVINYSSIFHIYKTSSRNVNNEYTKFLLQFSSQKAAEGSIYFRIMAKDIPGLTSIRFYFFVV